MKITADTNVLLRATVGDDERQGRLAKDALALADTVVITIPALCELGWVLSRGYKTPAPRIAEIIRNLADSANVVVDRPVVAAGLEMLEAGGDFADGVIAYEGAWLGADEFVSFDKQAVSLLVARGRTARLL